MATTANRTEIETMKILEVRAYGGPSYWSSLPVIRILLDIGEYEQLPSHLIPGFNQRLTSMLPTLEEHTCSLGRRGGFLQRLEQGTWMGHIAEHVALELQCLAGTIVTKGKTRSAGPTGHYNVIFEYREQHVGTEAGKIAIQLVQHVAFPEQHPFDLTTELERLIRLAERTAYGPSTQALVDEALRRDIPVLRLNDQSLVQLGHGVYQKRIRATMTSVTSSIAVDAASDKRLTNRLLSSVGIPVPRIMLLDSEDDAVVAANRIGYPVVIKPLDANHGRGVGLNLRTEADIRAAYREARRHRSDVIMESYITGRDYRVLVVNGKMVACAERVPACVYGDGELTVAQLVVKTNTDPRRGIGHEKVLTRIALDDSARELVRAQGLELDSVPEAGKQVMLRLTGNMSTGGISIDRTFDIHQDNIEIAQQAAQMIGLDVAGIDIITDDIAVAVKETGGAICEVNAAPGFRMHTHPTEGEPRDVARPVIESLFPRGAPTRVPIIAVTGTNGKTTTARMISHILKLAGRTPGLTSTDGVHINGRQIARGDMSGPRSAQAVLMNPTINVAVLETARGGIVRSGLGYDRNDVAVVTNVTGDHLGLGGIDTVEQLARVKAVIVEAVPRSGAAVLNADDRLVARMARLCRGDVIYFTLDPENELVKEHLARGGTAFTLQHGVNGEMITIQEGRRSSSLVWSHLLPSTFEGKARFNVANALAAAAACYASGVHPEDLRQGLRTFTTSYYLAPGRLNVFDYDGTRVIVDYCHNVAAMNALGGFVQASRNGSGRVIGVIASPGDRRDEDLLAFGEAAAPYFDEVIVREDDNPRGRQPGSIAELVKSGLLKAGKPEDKIEIVLNEIEATLTALQRGRRGDLIVINCDHANTVWKEVVRFARPQDADALLTDENVAASVSELAQT